MRVKGGSGLELVVPRSLSGWGSTQWLVLGVNFMSSGLLRLASEGVLRFFFLVYEQHGAAALLDAKIDLTPEHVEIVGG